MPKAVNIPPFFALCLNWHIWTDQVISYRLYGVQVHGFNKTIPGVYTSVVYQIVCQVVHGRT